MMITLTKKVLKNIQLSSVVSIKIFKMMNYFLRIFDTVILVIRFDSHLFSVWGLAYIGGENQTHELNNYPR